MICDLFDARFMHRIWHLLLTVTGLVESLIAQLNKIWLPEMDNENGNNW